MENSKEIPKIVFIGVFVMMFVAVLAVGSYFFETIILTETTGTPMFELFADAFKVGLGAFIGVNSQWATVVFKRNAENKDVNG